MKRIQLFIPILLLLSCKGDIIKPEKYTLIIAETSDVHGAIFDYDFIDDKESTGSLSKVHSYVKKLRESNNVLLLDNGDVFQGQPIVYYYNYEDTQDNHICSDVMNLCSMMRQLLEIMI